MLRIIAVMVFLMVVIPCAAGPDANSVPYVLRDKGKQPVSVVREITTHFLNIPGASPEPCHFRFTDPFFGYLTLDEYSLKEKVTFNFICYDVNDEFVQKGWARKAETDADWQLNMSAEEQKQRLGEIHFYRLKSINASGWAITVDGTIGDERYRERKLFYCLINSPQALCGYGDMGYLSDGPKADLTAYSLKILSSVEFLDDIPAAAESTPKPK